MPLPTSLLQAILAFEKPNDFTREFTAIRGKAHINFLVKGRLHERLRHIQVENWQAKLVRGATTIIFTGADAGVGDVVS